MTAKKPIQYVAALPHVREVTIGGAADLCFWTDRLRAENVVPLESGGRAQVLLIAADSKFKGVSFQELSISIALGQPRSGAFLAQAFNSRRFFAFCERTFFKTPYAFADVRVTASLPAAVQVRRGDEVLLRAEMGADSSTPPSGTAPYQDGWDGPIFLGGDLLFFAKIHGATQMVAFQPSRDVLDIRPSSDLPVLQALIDSRFEATHWLIRQDATHSKSKTYDISWL